MKTPRSSAELQIEAAINHMEVMINKQNIKIEDAKYLKDMAAKVLYKCEELRKSRDIAIMRRNEAQEELKAKLKLK